MDADEKKIRVHLRVSAVDDRMAGTEARPTCTEACLTRTESGPTRKTL